MALLNLPRPNYLDRDPAALKAELVAWYEAQAGKTLYPAQPEMLMIDLVTYVITTFRISIQEAAEQNNVQYAQGIILDHIAQLFGILRQEPLKAKTVLRFTADNDSRPAPLVVYAGAQIRSQDQRHTFVTLADVFIDLTETFTDVEAEAMLAGSDANGYAPGSISEPLTSIAWLESVANTIESHSGADRESDEQLRERTVKAPESFSVAGPTLAYDFWARSAHPAIIDVAVDSSLPGRVEVYPLTTSGSPSQEVIDAVTAMISAEKKRPLTDTVRVLAPTRRTYSIEAQVTLYAKQPEVEARLAIQAKLEDYADQKRKKLGRDVVLNHIIALIQSVTGVYDVQMVLPVASIPVSPSEFADCTSITVTLTTPANEEPVTYQYS